MIQRTYLCEGPECNGHNPDDADSPMPCHAVTDHGPPHLPLAFIETRERTDGKTYLHHFCSWDCLMKFAAKQPVPERIDL